jgi:hypothetical protein
VRPEWAPLLSSYLSSSTVGRCLRLWPIFSYVMPFLGFGYLVLYLCFLFFFTSGFLPHFLEGFFSLFYV